MPSLARRDNAAKVLNFTNASIQQGTAITNTIQQPDLAGSGKVALPAGFVVACVLAFVGSVFATVHFCRSMDGGMGMPGGWTMSMMWMRMPGQTWSASAVEFLLMWLAMMVAMMLPSALPMFLNTRRAPGSLAVMTAGYFAVWLAAGAGIYALGVPLAAAAMRWGTFSRMVPALFGLALVAAGVFQFTRWKTSGLLACRSRFGCLAGGCPERETNFRLGCKQGATCCVCCTAPMMILLVLGMMNPLVMTGVALVIAAEKLMPKPELISRISGVAAVVAGVFMIGKLFYYNFSIPMASNVGRQFYRAVIA